MKLGIIIVCIALMGSILIGSVAVERQTVPSEGYERMSDLAPLVQYGEVETTIQYNPAANVTGWVGAGYTTQSAPSLYSLVVGSTSTSSSLLFSAVPGVHYAQDAATASVGSAPTVEWSDGSDGWRQAPVILGGYKAEASAVRTQPTGNTYYYADAEVSLRNSTTGAVTEATLTAPVWFVPLDSAAKALGWATGTVVSAADGVYVDAGVSFDGSYNIHSYNPQTYRTWGRVVQTVTAPSAATFWWSAETQSFYRIVGQAVDGSPAPSGIAEPLVWVPASSSASLPLVVWTPGSVTYVTPRTEVSIPSGASATWSNGYNDTAVELIVQAGAQVTDGVYAWSLGSEASAYARALMHIDADGSGWWQGIVRYGGPSDYETAEYKYPLVTNADGSTKTVSVLLNADDATGSWTWRFPKGSHVVISARTNGDSGYPTSLDSWDSAVYGSAFSIRYVEYGDASPVAFAFEMEGTLDEDTLILIQGASPGSDYYDLDYGFKITAAEAVLGSLAVSGTPTAYVLNTWMPGDPDRLLWGDPSVPLGAYFPDTDLRLVISGYVQAGDTLTVNGRPFDVADGQVSVDGAAVPLKGLTVSFASDGHTYLGGVDLGETADRTVSGTGAWYLSGEVQRIVPTTTSSLTARFADVATQPYYIFAFLGLLLAGTVAVGALSRGSLGLLDVAVIIGAGVIGVMLL